MSEKFSYNIIKTLNKNGLKNQLLHFLLIIMALNFTKIHAEKNNIDWEIALVTMDQIELLQSNGTLISSTVRQFTELKALTYDQIRNQFIVSDMDESKENDTIFTVHLSKETEIIPILPDLPDDVQGLAIDTIEDILYWTDAISHSIKFVNLNNATNNINDEEDENKNNKIFLKFENNVKPHGIAIDVCRRFIYWTNSYIYRPTIERAFLNGTNHEILIDSDLKYPTGITIDYHTKRIFWAERSEGIFYRIHSANLDGKEREIIASGAHMKPFGIAVDQQAIYWTDNNNNALWRISKSDKFEAVPEKIRQFAERPWGIIARNIQIRSYPECRKLEELYQAFPKEESSDLDLPITDRIIPNNNSVEICLNGGHQRGTFCVCPHGYSGSYCEIEHCYNFCIRGICHLSSTGYAQCRCPHGFGGSRCEKDTCATYCMNGGSCSWFNKSDPVPRCQCSNDFFGKRCEIQRNFQGLCEIYCEESVTKDDYLISKDRDLICRCMKNSFTISENNETIPSLYAESSPFYGGKITFMDKLKTDSDFILLVIISISFIILNIGFIIYHFYTTRFRRPIIKKRVIVNRNITPLTYRPQNTNEQCEITIENCCNMNICDTPCFEPPFLSKKDRDDKKKLLQEMENNEHDDTS